MATRVCPQQRQIARIVPPPQHLSGARRSIQARMKRSGIRGSAPRHEHFPPHSAAPVLSEVEGLHAGYVLRISWPKRRILGQGRLSKYHSPRSGFFYNPRAVLYNPPSHGRVAQLVEHATENRSVGSSILPPATIFPALLVILESPGSSL